MSDKGHHSRLIGVLLVLLVVLSFLLLLSMGRFSFNFDKTPSDEPNKVEIINLSETDTFLHGEELVMIGKATSGTGSVEYIPIDRVMFEYVEVVDSCGPHFEGDCLNARSGPGKDYPSVAKLRTGIVLKISGKVDRESDDGSNETWYKVIFDEWLRYPGRVTSDWYVSANYVDVLLDEGERTTWNHGVSSSTKRIVVDRSEQKLFAYDGESLFMEADTSTGLALTPTPRGTFTVFKKMPSRYMQGPLPIPGSDYYDLPGVPWNLYFTSDGAVIHGAYWHDSFGSRYSHGCVNLPPDTARVLYNWAELGMPVIVQD